MAEIGAAAALHPHVIARKAPAATTLAIAGQSADQLDTVARIYIALTSAVTKGLAADNACKIAILIHGRQDLRSIDNGLYGRARTNRRANRKRTDRSGRQDLWPSRARARRQNLRTLLRRGCRRDRLRLARPDLSEHQCGRCAESDKVHREAAAALCNSCS